MNKKGQKTAEKMFRPAFGCCKHPKAGRNTQQQCLVIPHCIMADEYGYYGT